MDVSAAASSGDERSLLVALRDAVAEAIDEGAPARDLAALSRRLMEISREIRALDLAESEESDNGAVSEDEEFDPSSI